VVGGLHFVDPGEDAGIPDDVMGNVGAVMYGGVVSDVAGDDGAVPYTCGDAKIVVFEQYVPEGSQADKAVKV
jgi:hypothetical protein